MTLEQFLSSRGEGWDIEAIRRYWDGTLQRLKVHAESAEWETKPDRTDPDSRRSIDDDESQGG